MKSYITARTLTVFSIALFIGGLTMQIALSEIEKTNKSYAQVSPEIYNSAFSPLGEKGGEIIPASCSIGYPCDAADGTCPCPVPSVTIFPGSSMPVSGGGNINWGFTSSNAAFCDFSTTMSSAGLGPNYYYVTDPNKTYNGFGPFANANGWVRYRIQCWDTNRTFSDIEEFTVNLSIGPKVNVLFGNSTSPFLNIVSFTGPDYAISGASLLWNVSGATSCSATGPAGWSGSTILLPTGSRSVSYTGTYPTLRTYTLTCTNGTESMTRSVTVEYEGSGGGCFIAGTKVLMADGSLRDIETVLQGESIMTSNGPGTIEKLWHIPYKGNFYAFNASGNYFVTDSHPFMTTEGWKSFNPRKTKLESPDLEVTLLKVGDTLIKEDDSTVLLESIDMKYTEQMVYNFKVSGAEDYYADGYWVHNPIIKP